MNLTYLAMPSQMLLNLPLRVNVPYRVMHLHTDSATPERNLPCAFASHNHCTSEQ